MYAANLFFWLRCLAGVSRERSPRPSILLPRPAEVREEGNNVSAGSINPDEQKLKDWAAAHLRTVQAGTTQRRGEACSSAPDIERAAMAHLQGHFPAFGADCSRATEIIRGFLLYTAGGVKVGGSHVWGAHKREKGGADKYLHLV